MRDEIVIDPGKAARVLGVVVVVVFVLIVVFGAKRPSEGREAPATAGVAVDGRAFDLAAERGHFVFVNVWATWCGPCVKELPALQAASQKWSDVRFVGLASLGDSSPEEIAAMVKDKGVTYPVVAIDSAVEAAWHVDAIPTSFLLSPEGIIVWMHTGGLDGAELDTVLAATKPD